MNLFAQPTRTLVALSLAIGLGGCSGLPGLLAGGMGLSGQAAIDAGAALTADALSAVNADEDLDRGAAVAQAASYTTQSLEAGVETTQTGSTVATSSLEAEFGLGSGLALRMERIEKRVSAQIDAIKGFAEVKPPVTTTHADGTVTIQYEITITRPYNTMHLTASKTLDADGKVFLLTYDATKTNKTGHSLAVHRERKTHADGTWTGTFESTLTRKDGKAKIVKWTVVGAADGSEKAEGTITRFDGSIVAIGITRSVDGTVVVVTHDTSARISTEATKAELDTTAEVKIVSDVDGKTIDTVKISDTTEVEVSDR